MEKNHALRTFLLNHARQLTEEWHGSLKDNDPASVYASADLEVVQTLKEQNYEFHLYFADIFVKEESSFFRSLEEWVVKIAKDSQHLRTPIHYIIREFMRVRAQYLDYIKKFVSEYDGEIDQNDVDKWNGLIIKGLDITILKFVEGFHKYSNIQLKAQQEMINELSSPVITLNNDTALLPLVGDIDTARAKMILENTLKQCAGNRVAHLYIDLSGVVMVDTMVAHQIFQLIEALELLGVKSTISGIRPEIAMTALQLGLSFDKISIKSTLSQAIASHTELT
ncbi:STAS domain-containing protein [Priestia abyssalis]|uniref:STAS domain-containing protein n=1 Tax=Priestia abyssalis TaxID=1221450 RepID=UPI0038B66C37